METPRDTRRLLERSLLLAVFLEAILGRLIVKGLEQKPQMVKGIPQKLVPPTWYVVLDYLALFSLYFATMLALMSLVVGLDLRRRWSGARPARQIDLGVGAITMLVLAVAVGFAATVRPAQVQWLLLASLGAIAIHRVIAAWVGRVGLASALGFTAAAAPIVVFCAAALMSQRLWNEEEIFGGEARAGFGTLGRAALVIAAMASPYCLAPRPLARNVTRILPFAVALAIAMGGAALLRFDYLGTVKGLNRVLGLDLDPQGAQDAIALYLLAFATVAWTIVACLDAPTRARQRIGVGLGLLVVAGFGFGWPMSFAVAAVGLIAMAEGAATVRHEERGTLVPATPRIDDDFWQTYVAQVVTALRGDGGDVSAVSVRGELGQTSTVILSERRGVAVRVRIERQAGAVVVLDVLCGRELGRVPTWTVVARRGGQHPEPPVAGPVVRVADPSFDEAFRCRGDRAALVAAIDDGLRARLAATVDGWIAGWDREAVRHRVFPGQGAPLDQPLPLSDLARRRPVAPAVVDRLVARIDLCAELARAAGVTSEPQVLPASEPDVPTPEEPAA